MTDITIRKNGPILVQGSVTLTGSDGEKITLEKDTFALCRCGKSENKPFCDGNHRNCGFEPDS